jgi:hypothetical protein
MANIADIGMATAIVDELKLYMSEDIKIANGIVLKCPKIKDIVEYGEKSYFSMAQTLCATPSSMMVALDDMKLNYMKISDFELFMMLSQSLKSDTTSLLLGDLDLTKFKPHPLRDSDEVVLVHEDTKDSENPIIINTIIYEVLITYIRKMHGFKKEFRPAGNEIARKAMIRLARQDAMNAKNKPHESFLRPIISAVKCRQGYSIDYIKQMGVFELMDDLSRLNVIVQADAALGGMYSGFVDTKKMDKTVLNWTRSIEDDIKDHGKEIADGIVR